MSKPRAVNHMVLRSKILNRVIHCGPRLPTEGSGYQISIYEEDEWDRHSERILGERKGDLPIPVVLLTEEETEALAGFLRLKVHETRQPWEVRGVDAKFV
ncbi:MAG: hypothetical protein WBG00_14365 [Thermoanaerobaculia bacterium]